MSLSFSPPQPKPAWHRPPSDETAPQPSSSRLLPRADPPALFLHPSPAQSPHRSISRTPTVNTNPNPSGGGDRLSPAGGGHAIPIIPPHPPPLRAADSARSADRTDALWSEMQTTLEAVEVSASGSTRVFSAAHERKLADLRAAQIALAQAWARSEADDTIETRKGGSNGGGAAAATAASAEGGGGGVGAGGGGGGRDARPLSGRDATAAGAAAAATEGGRSTAGGGGGATSRPASSGGGGSERLGARLEEETEADILLARRRREANDRYFERVSRGVMDVVAKLEDVAAAMREVELESKQVWKESEGGPEDGKP